MQILGAFKFAYFISSWLGGIFSFPLTLASLYYKNYYFPSFMCIYYLYRYYYPAKYWPLFKRCMRLTDHPYFNNQKIIFEQHIEEKGERKMFCIMPHGILTMGYTTLISSKEMDCFNIKWLVTDIITKLPFIGDILGWSNMFSINKCNMLNLMSKGKNIALIPGGFEEATRFEHGTYSVYINQRKGFIKYALQHGYEIYPIFVFGEEKSYYTLFTSFLKILGKYLNKYHIPTTFFYGKYFTPMPNNDLDLNMVIGRKLKLPTIRSPSIYDINVYHNYYRREVINLFNRNVKKYGDSNKKLIVY
jgi:hypothetical protein